jgi:hypothetical protein
MSWRKGFFARIFGRGDTGEGETMIYSLEEIGTRSPDEEKPKEEPKEEEPRGFTVERAARIIDDLPSEVPRESVAQIVRRTLAAAGIEVEDLERSTRTREAKLESEINLSRSRQKELSEKTEEAVRSLEDAIKKSKEACDSGVAEEEENISRASERLKEVRRVRAFFGFTGTEREEITEPARDPEGDETQRFEPFDTSDRTQPAGHPSPLADPDKGAPQTPYDPNSER